MVENIVHGGGGGSKREEKTKKKKKEKTSDKLENGSADYLKTEERKRSFLRSIAAYLEENGFSNTLAAFQSEAQLLLEEADSLKGHSLDLDDIFCKFVESCKDSVNGSTGYQEDQDVDKSHVNKKRENKCSGADDMLSKHKFDNHNGNESNALVADGMQEKAEERKRKKRPRADSIEETPGEVVQARVHEEIGLENEGNHMNESNIKSKSKKKKKVKHEFIEVKSEVLRPSTEASCQPDKLNTISKDQKNKKHKLASGSPENDGESKSKERKKKRHNTNSEHLDAEANEDLDGVMVNDEKKDIDGNQEDLSKSNLNYGKSPFSKKLTSCRDEKTEMDPYSLSKKRPMLRKDLLSQNLLMRFKE